MPVLQRYDKERHPDLARKYCLLGATDKDLARYFSVSISTINNWKAAHPEFVDAMGEGKAIADATVAESLYHRAIGADVVEGKLPADVKAAEIWLRNRRRDLWAGTQEVHLKIDHEDALERLK